MSRLWDKGAPLDARVLRSTAGEDHALDDRLVAYDVRASIAHAEMLHDVKLLDAQVFVPAVQASFRSAQRAGAPLPGGGLRSYGSMTYAGLKSMIYAGVGPDDPRVKAAFAWAQKHYDLTANPEMGSAGLYYYYHTFAKALDAMKLDVIEDASGVKHHWRNELAAEILKRQRPDGSWINSNSRWLEGEPSLVTGYALLTLSYCRTAAASR